MTISFILHRNIFEIMRVLFICNQHQNRSTTAEKLFRKRFITRSAGLYNEKPVTEKQIQWADVLVVMEDAQRSELALRFPALYLQKRILCLDVPDIYRRDQPELIHILRDKIKILL